MHSSVVHSARASSISLYAAGGSLWCTAFATRPGIFQPGTAKHPWSAYTIARHGTKHEEDQL
jgi:hypothetical protein